MSLLLLLVISAVIALDQTSACRHPWTSFEGGCYLMSPDQLSYDDARRYCRDRAAHLIDINSAEEDKFAFGLAQGIAGVDKRVFIGLNDFQNEGYFVWSDGTIPGYTHWESGQPNNYADSDCVLKRTEGDWNDVPCTTEKVRALCESSCPESWTPYDGSCYHLSTNKMIHSAAKTYCENAAVGSHLIDIKSLEENLFALDLAKGIFGSDKRFYIGLNDIALEGSFVWSDSSEPGYTNWEPDQPNGWANSDCVLMRNEGNWNDVPCSEKVNAFCEVTP